MADDCGPIRASAKEAQRLKTVASVGVPPTLCSCFVSLSLSLCSCPVCLLAHVLCVCAHVMLLALSLPGLSLHVLLLALSLHVLVLAVVTILSWCRIEFGVFVVIVRPFCFL